MECRRSSGAAVSKWRPSIILQSGIKTATVDCGIKVLIQICVAFTKCPDCV